MNENADAPLRHYYRAITTQRIDIRRSGNLSKLFWYNTISIYRVSMQACSIDRLQMIPTLLL